ncbi:L-fuconolactonase [Granulicella rosea]|uniref:L-fuconolactonase n=1 Tax=Granulicella rosea TaxID=474952 RepID=A0A239EQH6_9BACT|nr:amidohydrolase family protein [Granulicella rosea]SNS46897.1 L-fuconolactonase [Granulicella rosea]
MLRIDAHHHLWRYDAREFAWLNEDMAALRRDFLTAELEDVLATAGVQAAVAVQARQSVLETKFLLQCARESAAICAVVGWAPLRSANLGAMLEEFADETKLVGLREIVQDQLRGFLEDEAFNRGVRELTARGLTYDLLIYDNQLDEATRFVRRHPNQRFVLDHAAKPRIAKGELEPWRTRLKELARAENVRCKLSGLATEADRSAWRAEDLQPYLDVCVEAFGTQRLMAGSDWPVCLVATGYAPWWALLDSFFAGFSTDERQDVFAKSAMAFYGIEGAQA